MDLSQWGKGSNGEVSKRPISNKNIWQGAVNVPECFYFTRVPEPTN